MKDKIFHHHELADGRSVWIQRTVIAWAGPEHLEWALVVTSTDPCEAPTIERRATDGECLELLADVLRDDVCETS